MADTAPSSTDGNCMEKLKVYAKTQKGIILTAEILISFIILICYAASQSAAYCTVAILTMIFSMVFFGLFMTNREMENAEVFVATGTDLFRAGMGACLYLITSLINMINACGDGARIAGGLFGLIAGLIFAYDTYIVIRKCVVYVQMRVSNHSQIPVPLSSPRDKKGSGGS